MPKLESVARAVLNEASRPRTFKTLQDIYNQTADDADKLDDISEVYKNGAPIIRLAKANDKTIARYLEELGQTLSDAYETLRSIVEYIEMQDPKDKW